MRQGGLGVHRALHLMESAGPGNQERIGWQIKRQSGSHRTLSRPGWQDYVFAFPESDEIGPRMLTRIARHAGLKSEDP